MAKKTKTAAPKELPWYKDPDYINWTEQPQHTLLDELLQDCKDIAADYGYEIEPALCPSKLGEVQSGLREIKTNAHRPIADTAIGKAAMTAFGIDGAIDDPIDYASIQREIGQTVDETLCLGSIVLTEKELSPWQRKDFRHKDKVWSMVRRPAFHSGLPHKHPEMLHAEPAGDPEGPGIFSVSSDDAPADFS